ncbi:MAG: hypothetical protein QOH72_5623 [Solirubrobacteraceae bacterium]|jgi:hypothetical protein|nr:hypothetical protein [Solirubrobacteraceae bacterium]
MHSSRELRSSAFDVTLEGAPATVLDVLPGFDDADRIGIVVRRPCGVVGASGLLLAAVTAFYDVQRERSEDFFVYPDYFVFHVGRRLGSHNRLEIWPPHKEVVVADEPEEVLRAINDRAITRLVVEDGAPGEGAFARETLASARGRIVTAVAYAANGRTREADVEIASNDVTEAYVSGVLEQSRDVPAAERDRIAAARAHLVEEDRPVETYRRVGIDEALGLLAPEPERRLVAV